MWSSSRLRPLKRAGAHALECCWRLAIRAIAAVARPSADRWSSHGGQSVLIVAPHPDDEAIGCVGTTLLHVDSGDRVCVAIATDGRRSRVIDDPEAMSQQRRREAADAAQLMQIERLEWIGLAEGNWSMSALTHRLIHLIDELLPAIIYAPSRIDFHPEHFKVAHALALALADLEQRGQRAFRVRIYQVQVPLTAFNSNLVADVSALASRCEAILRAYVSQSGSMERAWRLRRYSASWHGIASQAEEFLELSVPQYIALHRAPPAAWPAVFRGMRNSPMSDPLAYLAGTHERRRISATL
jgi:N-acetylglucosamine malate deacetylase 1